MLCYNDQNGIRPGGILGGGLTRWCVYGGEYTINFYLVDQSTYHSNYGIFMNSISLIIIISECQPLDDSTCPGDDNYCEISGKCVSKYI